jgi:very-short-patch-repair endonuclease
MKFRRQHPVGKFVLDFFCEELRVAIEIDGGIHLEPEQHALDVERQVMLEEEGIRFVRIPAHLVENDRFAVMSYLTETLSLINGSLSRRGRGVGVREKCRSRGTADGR